MRSDNGTEFVNQVVKQLCTEFGISCKQGPVYSPWVQGAVEKVNKTLKDKLSGTRRTVQTGEQL